MKFQHLIEQFQATTLDTLRFSNMGPTLPLLQSTPFTYSRDGTWTLPHSHIVSLSRNKLRYRFLCGFCNWILLLLLSVFSFNYSILLLFLSILFFHCFTVLVLFEVWNDAVLFVSVIDFMVFVSLWACVWWFRRWLS
jgi:hypothetical protein